MMQRSFAISVCALTAFGCVPTTAAIDPADPVEDILTWCFGTAVLDHKVKIDFPPNSKAGWTWDPEGDRGFFSYEGQSSQGFTYTMMGYSPGLSCLNGVSLPGNIEPDGCRDGTVPC